MNISEIQNAVAKALNADERLLQGGCSAFAEDTLDVQNEVLKHLKTANGVALVVVTPRITRDASGCVDGIPCDVAIQVDCIEIPALNRTVSGHMTAMDAAERVAHALDGEQFEFKSIDQTSDVRSATITARVEFGFSTILGE